MSPTDRNAEISGLLLAHRAALYAYIFSCVRNHADSEDVLQEVAVAVTTSFERLRDSAEFLPWAREIARRQVLKHLRDTQRMTAVSPESVNALTDAAIRITVSDDMPRRREALIECLEALSPEKRSVITSRYDGSVASMNELADSMGRTLSAVYGLVKRARNDLRLCVEAKLSGENP